MKNNNIKTLGQLSKHTRTDLKKLGFENFEINKIDIELHLLYIPYSLFLKAISNSFGCTF